MAFGKTFALTLLTFIGVNFGGYVLILVIEGQIGNFLSIFTSMSELAIAFFGPITGYPGYILGGIDIYTLEGPYTTFGFLGELLYSGTAGLGIIIEVIFLIVAPLLAAVVAGKIGEGKKDAFGGFFLAIMISAGGALTLILIGQVYQSILIITIITIILSGVITAFLYGSVALLLNKGDLY